jgi:hypothetical protein
VGKLHTLRTRYKPKPKPKDIIYCKPITIIIGPIAITRKKLIQALTYIDETAYTLANRIRKLTGCSMTADGVVQMMTETGMPVRYATPEVKEFLNIK